MDGHGDLATSEPKRLTCKSRISHRKSWQQPSNNYQALKTFLPKNHTLSKAFIKSLSQYKLMTCSYMSYRLPV